MLPRIFIQIAAYRDPECEWTLRDLFAHASHPERIFVGICWQAIPVEDDALLRIDHHVPQIRLMRVDAKESHGACWARHQVQQLWQGEEYVLQIDSHMRFEPAWDEKLIAMHAACPSPKAVLTSYPAAYLPPDQKFESGIHVLTAHKFDEHDGVMRFMGRAIGPNHSRPSVKGMFISGNFLFGPASMIHDVPYDPYLYFYGEEISLAVRLWTHGYDIYHPNENVLYHYYKKSDDTTNRVHWSDHKDWFGYHERAMARLAYLLEGRPDQPAHMLVEIERYGLGTERSLQEYETTAGISFIQKRLSHAARNCEFFGDPALRQLDPVAPPAGSGGKMMDLEWLGWIHGNLKMGCDRREVRDILFKAGFSRETVRVVLGTLYTDDPFPGRQ